MDDKLGLNSLTQPGEVRTAEQRLKDAKAVCKKYNITLAQAGVLRTAARKYVSTYKDQHGELFDGQIERYNVRADTLESLRKREFIRVEHRFGAREQASRLENAQKLIRNAWSISGHHAPFDIEERSGLEAWRACYKNLHEAIALWQSILPTNTVQRITEAGRTIAKEFKAAVGAEEE